MSAARGIRAIAVGAWDAATAETEHTVELARSGRKDDHVVDLLAGAAFAYTMAGNRDAAARLASEALDLARRNGGPVFIAHSLTALAGAIADREPRRARALLAESLELRATIGFERAYDTTHTALIAARIADWPLVRKLAPDAIRRHNWAGERPYLSGCSMLSPVLLLPATPSRPRYCRAQPAASSRLRPVHLAASGWRVPMPSHPPPEPAGTASLVTELRRQTTAILQGSLGEERLRQLRAEGQAMDDDHAVAYALDAMSRAGRG